MKRIKIGLGVVIISILMILGIIVAAGLTITAAHASLGYPYSIGLLEFPTDEGVHNSNEIEWWYLNSHVTDVNTGDHYGVMVSFHKRQPDTILLSIINEKTGKRYEQTMLGKGKYAEGYLDLSIGSNWWKQKGEAFNYAMDVYGSKANARVKYDSMKSLKYPLPVDDDGYCLMYNGYTYYYSLTRLAIDGTLELDGEVINVTGIGWMDHQWGNFDASNPDWEWFSVQLDNNEEIMIAHLYSPDTGELVLSEVNIMFPDGSYRVIKDFTITNLGYWQSPETGNIYSQNWSIEIPGVNTVLKIQVTVPDQEYTTFGYFWEGSCIVDADVSGTFTSGRAYAELWHKYSSIPTNDVAVIGISAPSWCLQGDFIDVGVSVANQGGYDESFTVTLTDITDSVEIGTQSVSLPAKGTADLTFTWNTTASSLCDHILLAKASTVPGETDTADNIMTTTVTVKEPVHDVAVVAIDAPLEAYQGDLVSVFITVKNQGTYSETTTVSLTDTTDNLLIGSKLVSLNTGVSTIVSFDWDATSASIGDHILKGEASVVEGETNTADNSMTTIVTIKQKSTTTIHVTGIDMALSTRTVGRNKFTKALATITIVDASNSPVQDATVYGSWSGATSDTDSGVTDTTGKVTLVSNEVKNPPRGTTYTFTVDNVTKSGWTYSPASNTETSDSIIVP